MDTPEQKIKRLEQKIKDAITLLEEGFKMRDWPTDDSEGLFRDNVTKALRRLK